MKKSKAPKLNKYWLLSFSLAVWLIKTGMEEGSGTVEAHESASAQLWKERSPVVMELEGKGSRRRDLCVGLGLEISQRGKHHCSGCVSPDFCITGN